MKVKLIISIFLPTIICFFISYLLDKRYLSSTPAYLMPMFFGTVLGFFNNKYYKYKIYFNRTLQVILICIGMSYLCFSFSFFLIPILSDFIRYLIENFSTQYSNGLILRLSIKGFLSRIYIYIYTTIYLIAPISILWSFNYIFKYLKSKFAWITTLTFLGLFSVLGYFLKNVISSDTLQMLLWMPLMIFPIQLILYQKELKSLFKPEKNG